MTLDVIVIETKLRTWMIYSARVEMLGSYVLGKSGLVFPKLTKNTIHMNSTQRNTRQNTDTKIMIAKAENNTK